MAATTPTGSRRTMTSVPSTPGAALLPRVLRPRCWMNVLSIIHGAGDCAELRERDRRAHLLGDDRGHVADAARRRASAKLLHRGDALLGRQPRPVAVVERVAGGGDGAVDVGGRCPRAPGRRPLRCAARSPRWCRSPAGSTHSPPMNSRSCSRMDVLLDPCHTQTRTGSTTAATWARSLSLSLYLSPCAPRYRAAAGGRPTRAPRRRRRRSSTRSPIPTGRRTKRARGRG